MCHYIDMRHNYDKENEILRIYNMAQYFPLKTRICPLKVNNLGKYDSLSMCYSYFKIELSRKNI